MEPVRGGFHMQKMLIRYGYSTQSVSTPSQFSPPSSVVEKVRSYVSNLQPVEAPSLESLKSSRFGGKRNEIMNAKHGPTPLVSRFNPGERSQKEIFDDLVAEAKAKGEDLMTSTPREIIEIYDADVCWRLYIRDLFIIEDVDDDGILTKITDWVGVSAIAMRVDN
jgi:hypothetical protein